MIFLNSCWQPWQMSKPSKKNLKSVVEENTALRLENDKLRERLSEEEETAPTKTKHVRENVSRIYDDGFHVCRDFLWPTS